MSDNKMIESMRTSLLTSYPGKGIWTLVAIVLNAFRLPFLLFYYIPASNRPHPDWSYKQAVRVNLLRTVLYNMSIVEMKTPLSLKPGGEKARFAVMNPAKPANYVEILNIDPAVKPEKIGVTWWPKIPAKEEKTGLVILHFHGGAYAIGDGRSTDAGFASKTLVDFSEATHVACPQYRLASNPGCRFPAQLQDAVTSYCHLVNDLGISPSKIVLSGDSAGANLALALTRYIAEHGEAAGLPKPAAALLWSCWVNPASNVRLGYRVLDDVANRHCDYIPGGFGLWGARGMTPIASSGVNIESPYISFLGNAFKTEVPLYLSIGECEVLYNDCVQLYDEMSAISGNNVTKQVEEHCVHDTILVGDKMGFAKEAQQSVKRANVWLKQVTAKNTKL